MKVKARLILQGELQTLAAAGCRLSLKSDESGRKPSTQAGPSPHLDTAAWKEMPEIRILERGKAGCYPDALGRRFEESGVLMQLFPSPRVSSRTTLKAGCLRPLTRESLKIRPHP